MADRVMNGDDEQPQVTDEVALDAEVLAGATGLKQPEGITQVEERGRTTLPPNLPPKLAAAMTAGAVLWNGGKPPSHRPTIRLRGSGPTMAEMVIEDRR
jgi:hypothetical protein